MMHSPARVVAFVIWGIMLAWASSGPSDPVFTINDLEYVEAPGFSVLVFHNNYPDGHQAGIELIQHGERVASNGFVRLDNPDLNLPAPAQAERVVDRVAGEVRARVTDAELEFAYTVRVRPVGASIHIRVDLDRPVPPAWEGDLKFGVELFPGIYFGKGYRMGDRSDIFPRQANGPVMADDRGELRPVPLATGAVLVVAPEDSLLRMQIERISGGEMQLIDARNTSNHNWLVLESAIPSGATEAAIEWEISPNLVAGWMRPPVIGISQVGYHPDQVKQAVLELDLRSDSVERAVLQRLDEDEGPRDVLGSVPESWGRFLRYRYDVFDFSSVRAPGLYRIRYGDQITPPFRISRDVFQRGVWQPTLETFFPVQMCHMRVRDRARLWHDFCHMDDALQAPAPIDHMDGYVQYDETETDYEPFEPIPGLNVGGWHDAGDNDLAAGSQAQTTLVLALARERFGVDSDQTQIDPERRIVHLHVPDGQPDLVQQIEHGVENLLTGYRTAGHSFVGIIANREVRGFLGGDVANFTDGLVYDASLGPDEITDGRSGKHDDRWVFTNRTTSLEYAVIQALAAASRVLRGHNDRLAGEALAAAEQAWHFEQTHPPAERRNAYVPGRPEVHEILATSELLITTGHEVYRSRLVELLPMVEENIERVGWAVVRSLPQAQDETLERRVRQAVEVYASSLEDELSRNPYGVPWRPQVWGIGWSIQRYAVEQFYLHETYPALFDRENVLRVVNYVLGVHPASSVSLTSGVGAQSLTTAYGYNMSDWAYIPGGMVSGTALIRPDFPELKEPYPFLWQQVEYVMGGAATYIFCVLAADELLNP